MATTQRSRTSRRTPAPTHDPALRGLLLVGVAVVLGAILLIKGGAVGFDSDDSGVEIGSADEGASVTTTTTTAAPAVTVAPSQVKVVAANGAGVSGLAGRTTDFLATQGYTNTVATDAASSAAATQIYWAQGFEDNAKSLAATLGLSSSAVMELPPGSTLASDQPADAAIVVVLGPDADAALTSATGGATTATTSATGATTGGSSGSSGSVTTTTSP